MSETIHPPVRRGRGRPPGVSKISGLAVPMDVWVGQRLMSRRATMKLSIEAMANLAVVDRKLLAMWERAQRIISSGNLYKMAMAQQVHPGWYFEGAPRSINLPLPDAPTLSASYKVAMEDARFRTTVQRLAELLQEDISAINRFVDMAFREIHGV